jgi:tRNA threonylcarbamoyladenosine biosynthesis protein TsaB
MILAIDTATQYAGLALYNNDGIFTEESWFAGRNHTIELMPRIARMLKTANLEVNQLTALAVSLGPGSFTGLRIGLAVAKGMALPHKLPVVGIPTLEITAYPHRDSGLPVWAIAQAGRGRILAACYDTPDDRWQCVTQPYLTTVDEFASRVDTDLICAGELDAESAATLHRVSHQKARVVSPASRSRRAGYLAELAAARLDANAQDDPDALVPIYTSSP